MKTSPVIKAMILPMLLLWQPAAMALDLSPQEQELLDKANDAFAVSNIPDAMKGYARLHHSYPEDDELEAKLATSYYLMNLHSYATRHANNLMTRNPQSIDALMILAQVSLSNNRVEEAGAYLQAVLSVNNQHAEAWRLLSSVKHRLGDSEGGEAADANYQQYK